MPAILFHALVGLVWLITATAVACVMLGGKSRQSPRVGGRVAGGDASH